MLNQDYPRFIKICKNPNLGKSIPGAVRFGNLKTLISITARIGQPKLTDRPPPQPPLPPPTGRGSRPAGGRTSPRARALSLAGACEPPAAVVAGSHVRSTTIAGGRRLRPTYVHYVCAL